MNVTIATSDPEHVDLAEIRKAIEDQGYFVLSVEFDGDVVDEPSVRGCRTLGHDGGDDSEEGECPHPSLEKVPPYGTRCTVCGGFPAYADEDPTPTLSEALFDNWRYEVRNGDTRLGFKDWYRARRAAGVDLP